jgi:tetratricopeptide (TPR) repeat protein
LMTPLETYHFPDLLALKTLCRLRANKVSTTRIRRALVALRERIRDVQNPLVDLKLFSDGKQVRVQIGGQKMEPVTGQLLLDFDQAELQKLIAFPRKTAADSRTAERQKSQAAEQWFNRALELERTGAPIEQAIQAYEKVIELDSRFVGALVNLGTIYFTARNMRNAEQFYRRALEADPQYALAHFNMGNLCDELGDRTSALLHYQAALRLHPNYADAHYNIALLYQAAGQSLKALRHWKTYLKLDPVSPWATVARRELDKLYAQTVLASQKAT